MPATARTGLFLGGWMLPLPIMRGELRGRWWRADAGGKLLRMIGGTYEPAQTAAFRRLAKPGATVFDVGAHSGYYTLLAARAVGPSGRVVAFEPHPRNLSFLRWHVRANRCGNVRVEDAAVSREAGTARFGGGSGSGTGHLDAAGPLVVRTVQLDEYVRTTGWVPDLLKVDVEGAELDVLGGAASLLAQRRPVILLSTHGADVHRACMRLLEGIGYRLEPIAGALESADELIAVPAGAAA